MVAQVGGVATGIVGSLLGCPASRKRLALLGCALEKKWASVKGIWAGGREVKRSGWASTEEVKKGRELGHGREFGLRGLGKRKTLS
jgi:hypothetical protein